MDKKIYKDPFVLVLLSIIVIIGLYSQTAASQAPAGGARDLQGISGLSFISLIVYAVLRPYLRKKQVKLPIGIIASVVIALVVFIILLGLLFGLAMSGG
jgi:hypothetical protein